MEDKSYGIKTHLVEEFRELQISRQKSTMVFVGNCSLFINSAPIRTTVEAGNGIISITPFPLFAAGLVGYRIPPPYSFLCSSGPIENMPKSLKKC
jgi:hypothetical protein